MRAVRRLTFRPGATRAAEKTLIDGYLGRRDHVSRGAWAPAPEGTGLAALATALVDTSGMTGEIPIDPSRSTIWHVLWIREEASAAVTIAPPGDTVTWPIAPGDSVTVPAGASLQATGGQLAIAIAVPDDAPLAAPTHGAERFFGYNRQTTCCTVGGYRLCRWKLTEPLALAEHHPAPVLVLALARNAVVRTATTIDRIVQGELALIDPAAAPIVSPDGLAYLLTLDREPGQDGPRQTPARATGRGSGGRGRREARHR